MKVKQRPEDFLVQEFTDLVPTQNGLFAFYRLEKRGWSTPAALDVIQHRWRIEPPRLSVGGFKDRHALTVQYLTILHGPRRNLRHNGVTVTYLGQVNQSYSSHDIRANHFRLTLRELTEEQTASALQTLEEVRVDGVPNYFDDQRFGSVAPGGVFIAKLLVLGRFEEALRVALVEPYEHDRAAERKEKALLRSLWGDWRTLEARLSPGPTRTLVSHLVRRPDDLRGAVVRLRPDLRGLYLSAYQSDLWNRMLARWVIQHCRLEQIVPGRTKRGDVPLWRNLDADQRRAVAGLTLPLPSARLKLAEEEAHAELVRAVMAEEGLELCQMQVKGVRELFFSKGARAALCLPAGLEAQPTIDELHKGLQKLVLTFELPRGCYATLLVKRLQA